MLGIGNAVFVERLHKWWCRLRGGSDVGTINKREGEDLTSPSVEIKRPGKYSRCIMMVRDKSKRGDQMSSKACLVKAVVKIDSVEMTDLRPVDKSDRWC